MRSRIRSYRTCWLFSSMDPTPLRFPKSETDADSWYPTFERMKENGGCTSSASHGLPQLKGSCAKASPYSDAGTLPFHEPILFIDLSGVPSVSANTLKNLYKKSGGEKETRFDNKLPATGNLRDGKTTLIIKICNSNIVTNRWISESTHGSNYKLAERRRKPLHRCIWASFGCSVRV